MQRYEFMPPLALQPMVKCFWSLEASQAVFNQDHVVPDPYIELIINCGALLLVETASGTHVELPPAFLNGIQTKPLHFKATGLCQFIAVRFHPWAALSLMEGQVNLPNTSLIALGGVWQDIAQTLALMVHRDEYMEAIAYLQYCVSRMHRQVYPAPALIGVTQELLNTPQVQSSVHNLASRSHLSLSQFERRFKQLTSVSPKTFARLVRFQAIAHCLIRDPSHRVADLAYEFGYTDQAHLIRDFKTFAARTPGEFARRVRTNAERWQTAEFLQYA